MKGKIGERNFKNLNEKRNTRMNKQIGGGGRDCKKRMEGWIDRWKKCGKCKEKREKD